MAVQQQQQNTEHKETKQTLPYYDYRYNLVNSLCLSVALDAFKYDDISGNSDLTKIK